MKMKIIVDVTKLGDIVVPLLSLRTITSLEDMVTERERIKTAPAAG